MPTVPTYTSGQVRESAAPEVQRNPNAPAEAFGGGASANNFMDSVTKFALQEKDSADQLVTNEVYAKLKSAKNNLIYNNDNGLITRKGKDAFSAPDVYLPEFDKVVEDTTKDLDASQKARVQKLVLSEKNDLDETINKHMAQERIHYDEQTTKSGLDAARDEAINNFHDPDKVAKALGEQHALIQFQAMRNGLPQEWADQQFAIHASKTHTDVLSRMLANGDDLKGKAYFEANQDAFAGDDKIRAEKELRVGSVRGTSQRITDQIVSKVGTLGGALAEVKKIEDPEVRDEATRRVREEFSLRDAAKKDLQEQDFLNSTNILEKGGKYSDIPPSVIARMPINQRVALKNYNENKESDPTTYYNLKMMAAKPELRDKFLQTNIIDYAPKLSKSDLKDIITDQAALAKGDDKTKEKYDGFLSDKQAVDVVAGPAGLIPGRFASQPEKDKYNQLFAAVSKETANFEQANKRKASPEEVTKIANQMVVRGITAKGFFTDDKKYLFEAGENDNFDIEMKDIPKDEVKKIQGYLRSTGKVDSDTSILELYKAKLKRIRSGK